MDKPIDRLKKLIENGTTKDLNLLYQRAESSGVLNKKDIMKVWYGITPLKWCDATFIDNMLALFEDSPVVTVKREDLLAWQDNKTRFLSSGIVPNGALSRAESLLKSFEKLEIENDCDFGELDTKTIAEFISGLGNYNRSYIKTQVVTINAYLKWRMETGLAVHGTAINPIQLDDIDIEEAIKKQCYSGPDAVVEHVGSYLPLNDGYLAPMAATLAWMGFETRPAVALLNTDVDLAAQTIAGVQIPTEMLDIVRSYMVTTDVTRANAGIRQMYLEDLGYLLKRVVMSPKETAVTPSIIANALCPIKMSYKDIWFSGRYFSMWKIEKERRLTTEDVVSIWGIKGNKSFVNATMNERLSEFQSYKQVFFF